jgi:hypothetical protein
MRSLILKTPMVEYIARPSCVSTLQTLTKFEHRQSRLKTQDVGVGVGIRMLFFRFEVHFMHPMSTPNPGVK